MLHTYFLLSVYNLLFADMAQTKNRYFGNAKNGNLSAKHSWEESKAGGGVGSAT